MTENKTNWVRMASISQKEWDSIREELATIMEQQHDLIAENQQKDSELESLRKELKKAVERFEKKLVAAEQKLINLDYRLEITEDIQSTRFRTVAVMEKRLGSVEGTLTWVRSFLKRSMDKERKNDN